MDVPAPEQLLRHREFVMRLARKLVGGDRADDVAQETWLSVWRNPPRSHGATRAWLATVTRNVARMLFRGEGRRVRHERIRAEGAANAESLRASESVADSVSRAELQGLVVNEVLQLEEPYRTAVILRFLEGLSPREVGRRTRTNVHTVRVRLRRALALLRGRLDASCGGDRNAWSLALVPLCGWTGADLAVAGAAVMGKKTAAVVVAWALVATGLFVHEKAASPRSVPRSDAMGERTDSGEGRTAMSAAAAETSPSPARTATEEYDEFQRRWLGSRVADVEGRVVGRSKRPVAEVMTLRWVGTLPDETRVEYESTTSADGTFSMPEVRYPLTYQVTVKGDLAGNQVRNVFVRESGQPVDIAVHVPPHVVGRVLCSGKPVLGAEVRRMGFNPEPVAEDGSYRIRLPGSTERLVVGAVAPGYWPQRAVATKKSEYRWQADIELVPGPRLVATVLRSDGSPAANEAVMLYLERDFEETRPKYPDAELTRVLTGNTEFSRAMGGGRTTEQTGWRFHTDAEGRLAGWFLFRPTRAAIAIGDYKGNVFEVPGVADRTDGTFDLGTIRLQEPPQPLRMRVVDARGEKVRGARVSAMDMRPIMQCRRSGMQDQSDEDGEIEGVNLLEGVKYKWWVVHKSRTRIFDAVATNGGTLRLPEE